MEIRFFLPFGVFAPRSRVALPDPPDPPDPDLARARTRRALATKLNPRLLKDIGLGDD